MNLDEPIYEKPAVEPPLPRIVLVRDQGQLAADQLEPVAAGSSATIDSDSACHIIRGWWM